MKPCLSYQRYRSTSLNSRRLANMLWGPEFSSRHHKKKLFWILLWTQSEKHCYHFMIQSSCPAFLQSSQIQVSAISHVPLLTTSLKFKYYKENNYICIILLYVLSNYSGVINTVWEHGKQKYLLLSSLLHSPDNQALFNFNFPKKHKMFSFPVVCG